MAGGSPITLVHPGEIMIICGIGLGILVVSSPKSVLVGLKNDLIKAFKGGVANKGKFIDLLVLLMSCSCLEGGRVPLLWTSMSAILRIVRFSRSILPFER